MPVYEYEAVDAAGGCRVCRVGFDSLQRLGAPPLAVCPHCGAAVRKRISAAAVGVSRTGVDDRARRAGFHKLKRRGKGEYERLY